MTVQALLAESARRGIRLTANHDRLQFRAPRWALLPDLRAALVERKTELIPVLWRLEAMQRLAVEAPRALVYARVEARGGPGRCFSCGDVLIHPEAYGRCQPCDIAADVYYATLVAASEQTVAL